MLRMSNPILRQHRAKEMGSPKEEEDRKWACAKSRAELSFHPSQKGTLYISQSRIYNFVLSEIKSQAAEMLANDHRNCIQSKNLQNVL